MWSLWTNLGLSLQSSPCGAANQWAHHNCLQWEPLRESCGPKGSLRNWNSNSAGFGMGGSLEVGSTQEGLFWWVTALSLCRQDLHSHAQPPWVYGREELPTAALWPPMPFFRMPDWGSQEFASLAQANSVPYCTVRTKPQGYPQRDGDLNEIQDGAGDCTVKLLLLFYMHHPCWALSSVGWKKLSTETMPVQ